MMLYDDISSNLPPTHGQSKCPTDSLQLGLKTGEVLEPSASEQMTAAFKSNDCLKSIPTSNDQGNWQTNHSEQRTRRADLSTGNQCGDSDMQNTDSKMHFKRVAEYANLQHPSYTVAKKIKLDEHLTSSDPIQEHWKKGALGYRSREMSMDASDFGIKESTKCSKEELSHCVNRLDSTILHNEMALAKLRSTLENLEESVARSNEDRGELEKEVGGSKEDLKPQLSCLEQVLLENRRKAEASHAFLDKMKSLTGSFRNQQPCATAVYCENKQRFMTFKKRLVTYLKNRDETQQLQSEKLNEQWSRLYDAWRKKMETVEKGQKQRSKKWREYFDKIFPEMQKQEEEKIQRYCSSISKLNQTNEQKCNVNETCDEMNVEAEVMKKLKSLSAQPPPLLDSRSRRFGFLNENGIVEDSEQIYSASTLKCSFWTDHEREIFTEKYIRNPKKFGLIASLLENKSVQDCVQFYYLTKKKVGYKKLQRSKYSRKLKIRATANNMKEEKAENKNLIIEPCEQFLSSGNEPNVSCEQNNASRMEPTEETAQPSLMQSSVEPAVDTGSSSPEHSVSFLPSNSSEPSLIRTDQSSEKFMATDVSEEMSAQKINVKDFCRTADVQPMVEDERIDEMQNSGKAVADDDNESVATLSADEAASHCPDDDNLAEKKPSKPIQAAAKTQNVLEMRMQAATTDHFRAGVSCDEGPLSPRFLPAPTVGNLEDSRHSSNDQEEQKLHGTMPAASPSLTLSPRNEFHRMVRSTGRHEDEQVKAMPELLPLASTSAQGRNQQTYSPAPGERCSDGHVASRFGGISSFARNTGSPTRIRDLIHAAIEKNLQAIDSKPDLVSSSRNDSKQFRSSSNLNYKSSSSSALVMENAEVQDLSMRAPRYASSGSKITSTIAGKSLQQPPVLYQYPNVDSPFHPRPAHTNHSDSRAGSLLDLANAAEYEHLRRLQKEQQQRAATERDNSFKRFEASLAGEPYGSNPAPHTWRQREEPVHKGSIMQGTPISTAHHYRFEAARQATDARTEGLGIHPATFAHNAGIQPEPVSWQRPSYPQVVPQISSEHNRLLHNDFLTAQQLRTMQESSLRSGVREQRLQSYHPPQDVPPRAPPAGQYDARTADLLYQPSRTAPMGLNSAHAESIASRQKLLHGSWMGGSHKVVPDFRDGPVETNHNRFPNTGQIDRNQVTNAKSMPILPCKSDALGWQKISAAQLIEQIINNQISKPDGEDKVKPSSILSRIDEIGPSSYDDSVFAHVPIGLRSNRNRNEPIIPRTSSKSTVPERTADFSGRTSEKCSIANVVDQGFISDMQIHRRDMELSMSERGCISGTVAPNNSLGLSSGMVWNDKALPSNIGIVNSEEMGLYNRQIKKPTTIGESLDAIVENATRHIGCKNPVEDSNQLAVRNFIAGSDLIEQVYLQQKREGFVQETGLNKSRSSSPKDGSMAKANRFSSDEPKMNEDPGGAAKDGSSSFRPFNWKTKLLREHQKQQVENENQTTLKSTEIESKVNDHQPLQLPSSENSLVINDNEGNSVVQSDADNLMTSRLSLPDDARCSLGSAAACAVGDQLSTIAATHQMMSTLLSSRSGRQSGQLVPPSSAAPGPIQPDPPPLKPTTGKDSTLNEAIVPEQCEKQANSPMSTGPESPNSDSRGSDQPGRLVIRMDSAED